jgi:hypothetical protein
LGMDAEVENLEACFVKLHCPEDQMITEYLWSSTVKEDRLYS